jgi:hypothetical protein
MSDARRFWYPGASGEPAGPAPAETLRDWLAAGALRPTSPLCVEGTEEWRPAAEFPEFADVRLATHYFFKRGGIKVGPHAAEEIKDKLGRGELTAADEVMATGSGSWLPVSAIPAFVSAAGATAAISSLPTTPGAGSAQGVAARPSRLEPIPYTPGTKPSVPGPYVSYSHPVGEIASLFEALRVFDEPPPPVPGARWRPRLMLCGALLLLALIVAILDLGMGFPSSPFAYLIPLVAVGILLVVAATGSPRPRPGWMRQRGPAGCVFLLLALPMASALSHYTLGDSLSVSPIAWLVAAVLGLAIAALVDNREPSPAPPLFDLSRMENCKAVVEALEHDAMPGKPASGWLDLTGPRQGSKVCRVGKAASGRQIRLYRDEWWRFTLPLRDGNRLRISAVERVKVKDAVRRRRRTKPEAEETVATVEVKLGVNTAAYRTKPQLTPATSGDSLKPGPIQTTPDSVSTVAALRGLPARFRPKDLLTLLALVYARLEPVKPEGGGTP